MVSSAPSFVAPRALREGSRIAVIAPSSPFVVEDFERGIARLRERYDVRYGPAVLSRKGYLAGDDEARTKELLEAIDDPTVDAIIAARGGYGATRIIEHVDVARVRAARKLLVGFSDVTALHALWARAGVRSIHGPMVAALGRAAMTPNLLDRYLACLEGAIPSPMTDLVGIAPGVAEGPLVGGNLAVLAALAGTPFAPPLDGVVLFLEDVGERPYRVDRMLTTLRHAGWLARVAGVALGAFTDASPGTDGVEITAVLTERLGQLGVPVCSGVPAGHVDDNAELPFGARVRLEVDEKAKGATLTFLEPAAIQ